MLSLLLILTRRVCLWLRSAAHCTSSGRSWKPPWNPASLPQPSAYIRVLSRSWTFPVERTLTGLPGSCQVSKDGSSLRTSHSDIYRRLGGSPLAKGGFVSIRGRGWADKSPFFTSLRSLLLHTWGREALSSWPELRVLTFPPIQGFPALPEALGEPIHHLLELNVYFQPVFLSVDCCVRQESTCM